MSSKTSTPTLRFSILSFYGSGYPGGLAPGNVSLGNGGNITKAGGLAWLKASPPAELARVDNNFIPDAEKEWILG